MAKPKADVERIVVLACSGCGEKFDYRPPRREEQPSAGPRCPHCQAEYPMGCQDCGHDLRLAHFYARTLRRESQDAGARIHGLFCPECTSRYDRMAVGGTRPVACARCGQPVQPGQIRLRSFTETEQQGAVAVSQTEYLGLCPACADEADKGGRGILWTMLIVFVLFAVVGLICWLMK
jgi:hypothetical protein